MIPAPIEADCHAVARVSVYAIDAALRQPLTTRCECPQCRCTQLRLLGLSSVDGTRISLINGPQTHTKTLDMSDQPLTLAVVFKCSLGHEFASVLKQCGSEVHQAIYLPD